MSSADDLLPDEDLTVDPLYVSSLKEFKWIVVAWSVNFAWVIGFCVVSGYGEGNGQHSADTELSLVLGMPSWVVWGVMLPWILASLFTAWFALTQIQDHPLDDSPTGETPHG